MQICDAFGDSNVIRHRNIESAEGQSYVRHPVEIIDSTALDSRSLTLFTT